MTGASSFENPLLNASHRPAHGCFFQNNVLDWIPAPPYPKLFLIQFWIVCHSRPTHRVFHYKVFYWIPPTQSQRQLFFSIHFWIGYHPCPTHRCFQYNVLYCMLISLQISSGCSGPPLSHLHTAGHAKIGVSSQNATATQSASKSLYVDVNCEIRASTRQSESSGKLHNLYIAQKNTDIKSRIEISYY